jgi:RraA family protein
MPIGFRILRRRRQVSPEIVDRFRSLPVANVSDVMTRMTAGGPRLRPYYTGATMAGPAFTVKTRPGDNLMIHKALDLASPGDIIVVDGGGDLTNSLIGELMVGHAKFRKLGGIVIYGSIRDSATLQADSFPVFAAGVTHRGPYKDGPGEINVPIALEGMVIEPGDLILGDADGLLCVPFDDVETVAANSEKKMAAEQVTMEKNLTGSNDRSWVDATLKRLGCDIES